MGKARPLTQDEKDTIKPLFGKYPDQSIARMVRRRRVLITDYRKSLQIEPLRRTAYKKRGATHRVIVGGKKWMPCLGHCGGLHLSAHKGDRVCPMCKRNNEENDNYFAGEMDDV